MQALARRIHTATAWLLVASIVVQVFLAGSALVSLGGTGDFGAHIDFGYTAVGLIALAVVLTAVAARAPQRDIAISFGILLLYVVQTALPAFRGSATWLAALHPVNALLLFAATVWYARRSRAPRAIDTAIDVRGPASPVDAAAGGR
ncbi:MAG TPA: DUF6220 domain-containing protein [Candidatus Limnocylindria bacterium]|nr:DUF6220 domain-containing protein [Candidatus Limnocylindria bacterium]